MSISKTANLVLIPIPGMGHLIPAVELARQLAARDPRLSVTVLIVKLPTPDEKLESHLNSLKSDPSLLTRGIKFIDIPRLEETTPDSYHDVSMEAYRHKVKEAVEELRATGPDPVAGLLLDMFNTSMIDVAAELGLPSYVFFPSCASTLRMMFHLQGLGVDVTEEYDVARNPDFAMETPGFRNPVPVKSWPDVFLDKNGGFAGVLRCAEKYRQTKGILINTFLELEFDLIRSLSEDAGIPPVYPSGPILTLNPPSDDADPIFKWLDAQPPRSVVFLCFGSRGTFDDEQLREIASGLERSGRRFLWSVRRKTSDGIPSGSDDLNSVLPEGFLERTAEQGRLIGWAPQARVLAHAAVAAFVSHCGWNSTLESLWYGVPIVGWPLYAEQKLNAFSLARELGVAEEIRIDYRQGTLERVVVGAAEVEDGIRRATEGTAEVGKKAKEMSEKARQALGEDGSSYASMGLFIKNVFDNVPV